MKPTTAAILSLTLLAGAVPASASSARALLNGLNLETASWDGAAAPRAAEAVPAQQDNRQGNGGLSSPRLTAALQANQARFQQFLLKKAGLAAGWEKKWDLNIADQHKRRGTWTYELRIESKKRPAPYYRVFVDIARNGDVKFRYGGRHVTPLRGRP